MKEGTYCWPEQSLKHRDERDVVIDSDSLVWWNITREHQFESILIPVSLLQTSHTM